MPTGNHRRGGWLSRDGGPRVIFKTADGGRRTAASSVSVSGRKVKLCHGRPQSKRPEDLLD